MKHKSVVVLFILLLVIGVSIDSIAQCPMCKMAAETNMQSGGSAGAGLNTGILYMLSIPYLLVGTMAYLWFKYFRKRESA